MVLSVYLSVCLAVSLSVSENIMYFLDQTNKHLCSKLKKVQLTVKQN